MKPLKSGHFFRSHTTSSPEFTFYKANKEIFLQDQKFIILIFLLFLHSFATHSCSLITKLTFFDTQATAVSRPLTWYLHGMSNP